MMNTVGWMSEIAVCKLGEEIVKTGKQFCFAGALALTRTAQIAQRDVRDVMSDLFILRNRWTWSGIKIVPARKENPDMYSAVYSKDWYMPVHESGGVRTPTDIGRSEFVIPQKALFKHIDFKKPIPTSYRPRNILTNKTRVYGNKPFKRTLPNGTTGIFVRKGMARLPIEMLYKYYEQPIHIKSRRWFIDTVTIAYDKHFEDEYTTALHRALATAL